MTTTITVEAQAGPGRNQAARTAKPAAAADHAAGEHAVHGRWRISAAWTNRRVYRINPDNTVETLWSSKEENVYDLLALENQVLFSTDQNGRIYGLSPDRRVTLVAETNEGETTRLLPSDHSVLAATGNMGRIFRLGDSPGASGSYEAPVHDSGTASRWGSLSWRADVPAGCALVFRTRSGNSARPDRTWSDWSEPLTDAAGSRIASPNARYIQWKVEMAGAGGATPVLEQRHAGLSAAEFAAGGAQHQRRQPGRRSPRNRPSAAASVFRAAYSVTVTDTGDTAARGHFRRHAHRRPCRAPPSQQITVSWQADDPDGDRLVYNLYFRAEDETQWMLLAAGMHDNSMTFDADILADGKYFFRVVASDRESNPPASAREAAVDQHAGDDRQYPAGDHHGNSPLRGGRGARGMVDAADASFRLAPLRIFAGRRQLGAHGCRGWRDRFAARKVRARSAATGRRRAPAGDPRGR